MRISLLDFGDPRVAFQKCVAAINIIVDPNNPTASVSDADKQKISDCRTKAPPKVWNATSLVIAGAPAWISTDGSTSNLKLNGGGAWVSFAYGFGDWGQLIADGRRQTGQQIVPPSTSSSTTSTTGGTSTQSTAFEIQDSTVAGGSFKVGRSDFNATFSGFYIGKRTAGTPTSYPEFGFGVEKKLASDLYLELSYRYDATQAGVSGLLTSLKWSFSQQAKLSPK